MSLLSWYESLGTTPAALLTREATAVCCPASARWHRGQGAAAGSPQSAGAGLEQTPGGCARQCGWAGGVSGAPSPLSAVPGPTGIRLEEKLAGFHRFHWSWGLAEASGHRAASLALSRGEGCRVRAPAAAEPLAAPSSSSHGLRLWTKPRLHRPPVHPQLPAHDPMVAPPRLFPRPLSLQGPQVTGQNLSRCPRQLLPSWTRGHPSAPAVTQPCAAWSVPPPGGRVSGERAAGRS